jgi:hypothetical protein
VQRIEGVPTREALLEHVRRTRAGPPAPPAPPPLTEAMRKRLEGRAGGGDGGLPPPIRRGRLKDLSGASRR